MSKTEVFAYEEIDADGKKIKGTITASTYMEARFRLERQGISSQLLKKKAKWWQIQFGKIVPPKVLLQTTRQLTSFAQAGIPVAKALGILVESTEHKQMKRVLQEIQEEIESGSTFGEALVRHPQVFPPYYFAIIDAANRTGDLAGALGTLNEYLDRDLRSRRAVKSAMYYPIVLIGLALIAIIVLSIVVLPRFELFFSSLGVTLPLPTRMLLGTTRFVGTWWWALLTGLTGLVLAYRAISSSKRGRVGLDRFKLKLPILGNLLQLVAIERFCRVLSTLTESLVPLPEALTMAGKTTGNFAFIRAVDQAQGRVIAGEGLAQPLGATGLFPKAAIEVFRIGEESGQLNSQLAQASAFYSDELDHRMKTFTSLLEPIVLLLVGGGVGFVAVALISAMYGIYRGVQ